MRDKRTQSAKAQENGVGDLRYPYVGQDGGVGRELERRGRYTELRRMSKREGERKHT